MTAKAAEHSGDLSLIGLVGAGVMGRGIAQIAAQAGLTVRIYDTQPGAAGRAIEAIGATLERLRDRGRITPEAMQQALRGLVAVESAEQLAACDLVIEAIVEKLEAKKLLFRELEEVVGEQCILATNTSSLSVTEIAASCRHPGRVAGFHFFNPVPLMKVVEVVGGPLTDPQACVRLAALAERVGHTAVRTADTPGFVVNHAGRAFGTEALQILREGVAGVEEIDRILCGAAGFRMGPFALLDLIGLDVSHAVMESIYHQYYQEPRYRPSPIAAQRVAAGLYGRKSPQGGFYRYDAKGEPQRAAPVPVPQATVPPVWVSRAGAGAALAACVAGLGATVEAGERPSPQALILIAPLGSDATGALLAEQLDPARTLAVDALFGLGSHRTLMAHPAVDPAYRDAAHALLARDGLPVSVIRDSCGFVAQRVVVHVVNIGCDIAQQRIASPADIDHAVRLGLGYPRGPLAWGDAVGPARVLEIVEAMFRATEDPRWRPSPWLRRRALLGVSLLTSD